MNRGGSKAEPESLDENPMAEHDYFHSMAHELITAVHGHDADAVREVLKNCANHLSDAQPGDGDGEDE